MNDYFALLDVPRRPWLDPEEIKSRFIALSGEVHPDRVNAAGEEEKKRAHQRYTDLNAAYQCLREPKDRLRHLLELERGRPPEVVQSIPPDLMDLFLQVGALCREVDAYLNEKAGESSPLLKAQLAQRGVDWEDKLGAMLERLAARRERLLAELRSMNTAWENESDARSPETAKVLPLARLEALYRLLSFLGRWEGQIRERRLSLVL